MSDEFKIGDHVEVFLGEKFGERAGWHTGSIVRIDPYSDHRSFLWVQFTPEVSTLLGINQISVFNPRNIRKVE